ncbi:MAG: DNA mismatch repair protein MutS [Oscillospiraceae bacterium]|nr:DNA mismatch repair protein MutS [Oscillospiraceae bacterium]
MSQKKPLTPMMQQYYDLKNENEGYILFYRLGDFYEMFDHDARLVSSELDLVLTTRDRNVPPEEQTQMCGVPYHSSEAYIARLIERGYSIAVCEQMGDPALAKGLVERKVVRYLTPGTVTESTCLDESTNNYLCALAFNEDGVGLCFADISAGQIFATSLSKEDGVAALCDELARFNPREIILAKTAEPWGDCLTTHPAAISRTDDEAWQLKTARKAAEELFGNNIHGDDWLITAVGATTAYLRKTQQQLDGLLDKLQIYRPELYVSLDASSRRHLELTESLSGGKRGSLLSVLDKTVTPMGKRLLRNRIDRPLRSTDAVSARLDAVQTLHGNTMLRSECMDAMKSMADMERLIARICANTANARDVTALSAACLQVALLKQQTTAFKGQLLLDIDTRIEPLNDIALMINEVLVDTPPLKLSEGGLIKHGCHQEVDDLRTIMRDTKELVANMETAERERTGIKALKVSYNRVFGYYIEISKLHSDKAPAHYDRKQTLVNCERFITPELKEMEATILTAKDRLQALEEELFAKLRVDVAKHAERIRRTATAIAELDVLCSAAAVAVANDYCRPYCNDGDAINIREGRHPVVEALLRDAPFVPNDTLLDRHEETIAIITGPNMAGKSTYMRQVALIALMAQMGFFVPAKEAMIGMVDAVFTRIGASDDLTGGRSTFMVEMTEVSHILTHATPKSLLILDEIGRGTSTFDGMAVAQAVLEHIAKKIGARSLFATHYHELTDMERDLSNVVNYNVTAKKRGEDIVFLRKVVRGAAEGSYGVEVAKLAGLPKTVVTRAQTLLKTLEDNAARIETSGEAVAEKPQLSLADLSALELVLQLASIAPDTLTPIEAMNTLAELHGKARDVRA